MQRLRNNVISSRSNAMVDARFREMDAAVSRSLACSGITHLTPQQPITSAPKIIDPVTPAQPAKKVAPKKEVKHRIAKTGAASTAIMAVDRGLSVDDVKAHIPEYAHPLPRRQWVRKFFDALPAESHEKYADLKKLYAQ